MILNLGNALNFLARLGVTPTVTSADPSSTAGRDANGSLLANHFIQSPTTTVTAASTTTLTATSSPIQIFTGTTTQTVKLPSTGVAAAQTWTIVNQSTGNVTVQGADGSSIGTVNGSFVGVFTATVATPPSNVFWVGLIRSTGKWAKFANSMYFTGLDGAVYAFPLATDTIAGLTTAQTFTASRIKPRVTAVASSATPTLAGDSYDHFNLTAQAVAITSVTMSGTPSDGEMKTVRIKDDGTARAIAWGSGFTGTLLTTTVASKTHTQRLIWDAAASKWAGIYADTAGY